VINRWHLDLVEPLDVGQLTHRRHGAPAPFVAAGRTRQDCQDALDVGPSRAMFLGEGDERWRRRRDEQTETLIVELNPT